MLAIAVSLGASLFFTDGGRIIALLMILILFLCPYIAGFHSHFIYFHSFGLCLDKMSSFLIILTF
jgi:hypothetical protein